MSKEIKTIVCGQCNCLHGCAKDELAIDQLTFIKTKMKNTGIELIAKERQEQIEKHGKTVEFDVKFNTDQLLKAAEILVKPIISPFLQTRRPYAWDKEYWRKMINKPHSDRLVIAGALIAAEIDRLQRLEGTK